MFIFADLFARYLESQPSRAALLEQLAPARLPVELDHVYERILYRILEDRGEHILKPLRQVLGWIAFARRPLKWAEIQGAICIDFENQTIDYINRLLDSPKELFASLVELQPNGTVELVHGTVREFLARKKIINQYEVDFSFTTVILGYLTLHQLDRESDEDVRSDFLCGTHAFYDYASSCWASHLLGSLDKIEPGDRLDDLQESLETFIRVRRSLTSRPLQDIKRIQKSLKPIQTSELFDEITQAVGWARKQSSDAGLGPNKDEALDIWQVTQRIRSVFESFRATQLLASDEKKLQQFYGTAWFKCPRVNCIHYYQGFEKIEQRNHHINRHELPFLCYVPGCHMEVFGYAEKSDLKKHLFKFHGIGIPNEEDELEFPNPPKRAAADRATAPATHQCSQCGKRFTRNHNLKNHIRSEHERSKPYECGVCGMAFPRKADCDRHKRRHEGQNFTCTGSLKNGSTWGCQKSFGRQDALVAHYRSKIGRKCMRPKLEEKMREGGDIAAMENDKMFDNESGGNADILQAVGRALPSFGEFLRLCGLDQLEAGSEPESNSNGGGVSLNADVEE
ncbi:hypothetical protein F4777DRAFT_583757 [Nemania sp. FL0916]|nr:hypothetical protein F4777DRAFT_583757 [Nemania sp. FL0916]